jgi:Glycosyltransferase
VLKLGNKKVLYVSDQKFYKSKDNYWYTTSSFSKELISIFEDIDEWIFFGRLYETENIDNLYRLNFDDLNIKVSFVGIRESPSGFNGYLRNLLQYMKFLSKYIKACDIIYLKFNFVASYLSCLVSTYKNKKLITHMVGDIECVKLIKDNFFINILVKVVKILYKYIVRKADIQIYVSNNLKDKYSIGKAKIEVICENRINECNIVSIEKVNKRINDETLKLLYVGRLSPEKGLVDILNALEKTSNITLSIIGSGTDSYVNNLKRIIQENGLDERVNFLGYIKWGEDLFEKFADYHSLILPSYSEGLPLVIVEAMSMGLPVIASNVGGIKEIIMNGENGIVFSPGNLNEIIESINLVKYSEELRMKLIVNGIETAKIYSLENQLFMFKQALISRGVN